MHHRPASVLEKEYHDFIDKCGCASHRATHASSPAPAERLGFTEFCNVHCDKHECCTNECERSAYEAAKAERERVRKVLIIEKGKQKLAFRDCWDENAIKFIKDWAQSLHLIEESLRAQQGGVSE
jgi:hypothetical protein